MNSEFIYVSQIKQDSSLRTAPQLTSNIIIQTEGQMCFGPISTWSTILHGLLSNSNCHFFTHGTHVIQYIATDNIGHYNQCEFTVTVKQRPSRHFCLVQAIGIIIILLFLIIILCTTEVQFLFNWHVICLSLLYIRWIILIAP